MNMTLPIDTKNSLELFGLSKKLNFLIKLYELKKIPKVLMLSGKKGIGKSTLTAHFLNYVFDKKNYDLENQTINDNSIFFKQFSNYLFPNIIYLSGSNSKDIKIDNIRNLKSLINKKTLIEKERFIILDDIELFNLNSLNALLKTLEEPTTNNYFILINNLSKPLIDTIRSRALEIKVFLNNQEQIQIIEALSNKYNIQCILDFKKINLTPGNFFIFNQICIDNKIDIHNDYLKNISLLFTLYKKDKNFDFINMAIFLTNYYFYNINKKDINIEKVIDDKSFIINNINKLILYNLNYNSVVQAISNRILNE